MATRSNDELISAFIRYRKNWPSFASEVLKVHLDQDQQNILEATQHHSRVSVRSGNARGKDFVAAVASLCFLFLVVPSIVIMTAPTDRQAIEIMMARIKTIYLKVGEILGGEITKNGIKFDRPDRRLIAFTTVNRTEAWTGFHSPNLMVVVTEASGIGQETFNAIESILTGNSKLLIVFNPNQNAGEAWRSVKDPSYTKFKLNCLNAPNVVAKKTIIPGQVDYSWVVDKVWKWCVPIAKEQMNPADGDFEFEGQCYRPNNLFLVKVQGDFPREGEDKLIPLAWIEAANQRWKERFSPEAESQMPKAMGGDYGSTVIKEQYGIDTELKLGVDVAGMGTDMTVFCFRYDDLVVGFKSFVKMDHMQTAGKVLAELEHDNRSQAFIDAIGEGAGVCSRLVEQEAKAVAVKFSESAKGFYDYTEQRKFVNLRAYCWWAIRDALDPQFDTQIAIPPIDELTQDLNEPRWKIRSDGSILLEEKDEIKARLGRSPDYGDALALTFYPIFYDNEPYSAVVWR